MTLKIRMKPVEGTAVQWFKGGDSPLVKQLGEHYAVNVSPVNSMREICYVKPGDYVVDLPGEPLVQVFSEKEFHERFDVVD
ncbi:MULTISPECIES: hypothetical protein [Herbaspirillum]|uniref:Uncharacterized protein n=2 Tax=Herbaspirillum huttiense TaxID=863372 RepID=A0AAJ2H9F0_9BURK|nr:MULTISPECIES: hypothetical protein [Herbaspirillum]MDR9836939.1 hypothetical protein [Herbaspirillum huttiense]